MSTPDQHDPFFVQDKAKALSWKDAPVGAKVVMVLDGPAAKRQALVYGTVTGEKDWWDDEKTQPKMNAILTGDVKGKRRSLWVPIPSALFYALATAQEKAGAHFNKGGTVTVTYTGTKPNDNPAYKPSRMFTAEYEPPAPDAAGDSTDPWSNSDEPPF